jgi:hypothetical protein
LCIARRQVEPQLKPPFSAGTLAEEQIAAQLLSKGERKMVKFLIPIVAAASALTIAAPASAQWAPPVYRYAPYNYGYGFSGVRFAQTMEARVQHVRGDIRVMAARRVLSWREARGLDNEARNLQVRIARATRYGINPYEARGIENGLRRLEYRVSREATDWNSRYGHRYRRY